MGSEISCDLLEQLGLQPSCASHVIRAVESSVQSYTSLHQVWQSVCETALTPDLPFSVHQAVARYIFRAWDEKRLGPHPLWYPATQATSTNIAKFIQDNPCLCNTADNAPEASLETASNTIELLRSKYDSLHAASVDDPDGFWPAVLQAIHFEWDLPPDRVLSLDGDNPDDANWFPGGRLNIAKAALWGPLKHDESPAIVYANEDMPRRLHTVTYGELRQQSVAVARSLVAMGLGPGAHVAIIMPMTVQAVVAYLGIILMGGAVVSVADSFSAKEIGKRLELANTSTVITQDTVARAGKRIELYQRICKLAHPRPRAIMIPAEDSGHPASVLKDSDISWGRFLRMGWMSSPEFRLHSAEPSEITNILFSSGTTGTPKAIPWTHITPLRPAVNAWACQDVRSGDVVVWPTNLGWMMGPWLIYATFLNSATIGLFLGAPTTRPFGEFVESAGVSMLGLVPSIAKAWRSSNCMAGLDWSCLRCYSSSGEASAPEDVHWLMARANYRPVIEYCGGTEIGGAFCSSTMIHPAIPSTFSALTLGLDVLVLSDSSSATSGVRFMRSRQPMRGEVAIRAPAVGLSQTLLQQEHREVYYTGMPAVGHSAFSGRQLPIRRHGDEVEVLPGGYFRAHGRCDDTMNLGGIKVSSIELEQVCVEHVEFVVGAAAVAAPASGGGPDLLFVFLVLAGNTSSDPSTSVLQSQCQNAIRTHLNPLFKVHKVILQDQLPRNASNKVMRRVLRSELNKVLQNSSKL